MLVNCKYLINLHGYFYASMSSLLISVVLRVRIRIHIRVGDIEWPPLADPDSVFFFFFVFEYVVQSCLLFATLARLFFIP